jgi:hypothetical protein
VTLQRENLHPNALLRDCQRWLRCSRTKGLRMRGIVSKEDCDCRRGWKLHGRGGQMSHKFHGLTVPVQ